jgi:hypothetical protein
MTSPPHESNVVTFADELGAIAELLQNTADRASKRRLYGLAESLRQAAASADSWSAALADDPKRD